VTGSGLSAYDFASARLDASNRTGAGGVDLFSGNFNWSLPLVGLAGRAGLDLGLSLSYNSLVWTKSGNYVLFDGDGGWPSPGFRLGFPVVQGKFTDTQAGKTAYMLITPSGARVSLRQTAAGSTVYEAGDSSYLQLRENQDGTLAVLTTGGTRMTYSVEGGVYKCAQIEDSNGNLIAVAYDGFGNISTVTDTLGRVLTFNYDGAGYLQSITQTWHREVESGGSTQTVTETHYWAQFTYADVTVGTNFTGLTVFGPANGQTIHALQKVQLADDSSYTFGYTTWGQVNKVTEISPDGHALNYVSLNLPADGAAAQTDCPRFTESRVWAAYWNGDADGTPAAAEEAATSYAAPTAATWQNPVTGEQESGSLATETTPDGTLYKEYSHSSGWDKGLVRVEEFWSGGAWQKRTALGWTQDDETLQYRQNPRVGRTDIYDSGDGGSIRNHRRTDVDYGSFGLPSDVMEYDSAAQVVLRRTHTEYLPDSITPGGAYVNPTANPTLRIIGLPSERDIYGTDGGQEKLYSKLTFEYDLPNDNTTQFLSDAGAVTQHDSTYGTGFTRRGNLCRVRRWDVTDPQNTSKATVASEAGYNTLGSVAFSRDALGHTTSFAYTDVNNAGGLAYPTTVTDPDNFSSTVEYNYDMGVATRAVDPKGAAAKSFYDAAGRRLKVKSEVNGSYTRWEYGAGGLYAKQFTTVDTGYAETFVMSVTDGAGRAVGVLRDHPGSTTGYAASRSEYDNAGQLVKQYSPVEVSVGTNNQWDATLWAPAGDDANPNGRAGWPNTQQTYDWKGRPKETTNPDGTKRDVDYDGCGCAGGEVVTTQGESVPIPGTTGTGRRTQKVYSDSLGRQWKTELLNWDGTGYSTTEVTFNALDQATLVRQYQGNDQSGVFQDTILIYDGYGRLKTKHRPEQQVDPNNSSSTDHTTFDYNADDTLQRVTDARGATTSYTLYNNRGLPLNVSYGAPAGSNINVPPSLTLTYDEAANRTSMTQKDGSGNVVGSCTYHYDTLSRLTSEDRQFPGLSGTYTISYGYTLAGQLKSVTDQTAGTSFAYTIDAAGRLTQVDSTGFGAGAPLASGVQYRAWGALKHSDFGNGTGVTLGYDGRGMVSSYSLSGVKDLSTGAVRPEGSDVQYYPDGLVKFASDYQSDAQSSGIRDRTYQYDHAGRLLEAYTGTDARNILGGVTSNVGDGPYRQSYTYDEWDNQKSRTGRYWSQDDNDSESYTPQTGRNQAWSYDADGRLLSRNEPSPNDLTYVPARYSFDAAGRQTQMTQTTSRPNPNPRVNTVITTAVTQADTYDGDGLGIERAVTKQTGGGTPSTVVTYYLRSAVLGGRVVAQYNSAGARQSSYAWADGEALAEQTGVDIGMPQLKWERLNPVTGDGRETDTTGRAVTATHLDPSGVDVGESDPFSSGEVGDPTVSGTSQSAIDNMVAALMPGWGGSQCSVDGQLVGCGLAGSLASGGAASPCPDNECSKFLTVNGLTLYESYHAYADGVEGYLPGGIDYVGDGFIFNSFWTGGEPEKNGLTDNPYESLIASFDEHNNGKGKGVKKHDRRLSTPSPQRPQNPFIEGIKGGAEAQVNPCPPVPEAPPGVSIDNNIMIAERHRPVGIITGIYGAQWFYNIVRGGGSTPEKVRAGESWNYKKLGRQYQEFGNFNYGATGAAIGFSEDTLLIEAGRAQVAAGTSKPEWGSPGGRIWGKPVPPYGDDPADQAMIKRGIEYYIAKKAGCGQERLIR
jgi:YD repeat-containing protein